MDIQKANDAAGLDRTEIPITLLTLPVELRLRIYNYALVSRGVPFRTLSPMDGDKKIIAFHDIKDPKK
jgi:hypothetical protein